MTDKQIIIDGVDVHWCEHYTGNIGYLTDKNWTCRAKIQGTKCEDWSNCYFKRWQRKEQECEGLRYEVGSLENNRDILQEQLDQLKEQLEAYKMEAEEGKEINAGLQAENESLENQLKSEKERFEKQDKFAAMYIQELKNEKSSLIKKFLEKIGQLQSENEELKKQLAELISQSALLPKFFGLSAEEITQLTTKCSKLSKTLTEIKEIAEGKNREFIDNDEVVLEILQKISEVEDDNR